MSWFSKRGAIGRLDVRVWESKRLVAASCLCVWVLNIVLYAVGVRYPGHFGLQAVLLFCGIWVVSMDEPEHSK